MTKDMVEIMDVKPEELKQFDASDDYAKWRYKNALNKKVRPVLRVFLKNINFFENWKRDLNLMILGSGYMYENDLDFLKNYVGENGKIYLVDRDSRMTRTSLEQHFNGEIPKQFVLVEKDISDGVIHSDDNLETCVGKLKPGETWEDPAFPAVFQDQMDIVISGLILSNMRMQKRFFGKEQELADEHLTLLDTLRTDNGHVLVHDDCRLSDLFRTRSSILNALENMNTDAHLKYDWPPDNIAQFPSIDDVPLQTFMVHVRSRQSSI